MLEKVGRTRSESSAPLDLGGGPRRVRGKRVKDTEEGMKGVRNTPLLQSSPPLLSSQRLAYLINSTQLNLLIYGSCEAGLNKHREHTIKHKA